MKVVILVAIFVGIAFSLSIISIFASPDNISYPHNASFFYLIASLLLLLISFVPRKESFIIDVSLYVLIIFFTLSSLIFSLIVLYSIELKYNNLIASLIFIISLIFSSMAIVILSRGRKGLLKSILLTLFMFSVLLVAGSYSLIQMYNASGNELHSTYSALAYFMTSFFLVSFLFLVKENEYKILTYTNMVISILFIWIGIKLLYSPLCTNIGGGDTEFSTVLLVVGIFMISLKVVAEIGSLVKIQK